MHDRRVKGPHGRTQEIIESILSEAEKSLAFFAMEMEVRQWF